MAANDTRVIAIEVQKNIADVKAAVDALKTTVDAIDTIAAAWVVNSDDLSLPAEVDVKAQAEAYEALSTSITKPALSLSDSLTTVKAAV